MMKRFLMVGLALLMCVSIADARKKRERSGEIDKGVYTDTDYGFQFNVLDNWDGELQKKDSDFRVVLTQKDHKIPPALMPTPQLARVPTIDVYICEPGFGSALEFIDSLTSWTYSSGDKKKILREILTLEENVVYDGLKPSRRTSLEVDGLEAGQWEGTAEFTVKQGTFETSKRSYAVGLVEVKNGKYMLSFTITCEGTFFPTILKEATDMIKSLKWAPTEEENAEK